jgi:hypothetical protein
MARHLADMWNNGLLLFYGSIALVVALDVLVNLAGDGMRTKPSAPPAPVSAEPGRLGAMIEGVP